MGGAGGALSVGSTTPARGVAWGGGAVTDGSEGAAIGAAIGAATTPGSSTTADEIGAGGDTTACSPCPRTANHTSAEASPTAKTPSGIHRAWDRARGSGAVTRLAAGGSGRDVGVYCAAGGIVGVYRPSAGAFMLLCAMALCGLAKRPSKV